MTAEQATSLIGNRSDGGRIYVNHVMLMARYSRRLNRGFRARPANCIGIAPGTLLQQLLMVAAATDDDGFGDGRNASEMESAADINGRSGFHL